MSDQNALFRKAALDKLSSPERLDVLMAVTSPRGWVALLALAGLLASVVAWSIYGSVPTRVEGQGILIRGGAPESPTFEPVVYVESTIGRRIHPGMDAQIVPSTVKRGEFGFMKGTVIAVGDSPVTPRGLMAVVGNQALANELLGEGSKIEVRTTLQSASTPSGYAWSSSAGPPFKIQSGTKVAMSVVVERRRPYTYILPILKNAVGVS